MSRDAGVESTIYCIAAATPEDVAWIARLEVDMYSARDAVPEHILKEWYNSNPDGFSVVSRLCNPANVKNIYAIAATLRGNRFLTRLSFTNAKRAKDRVDQHDLFAIKFSDLVGEIADLG